MNVKQKEFTWTSIPKLDLSRNDILSKILAFVSMMKIAMFEDLRYCCFVFSNNRGVALEIDMKRYVCVYACVCVCVCVCVCLCVCVH